MPRPSTELAFLEHQRSRLNHEVETVAFRFFDTQQVKRISVKEVYKVSWRDESGAPVAHGLKDPAFGPELRDDGMYVSSSSSLTHVPEH